MENIKIKLATIDDLSKVLDIYSIARKYMKENVNETQWGENYPPNWWWNKKKCIWIFKIKFNDFIF